VNVPGYLLPLEFRRDFRDPRGAVYPSLPLEELASAPGVACVGDVVSSGCLEFYKSTRRANIIIVYDGITRRGEKLGDLSVESKALGFEAWEVVNPPGMVSLEAYDTLCRIARSGGRASVAVKGEEDMTALALISCLPEGWLVTYGIPGRGVAVIRVTRASRVDAQNRLLELKPGLKAHG